MDSVSDTGVSGSEAVMRKEAEAVRGKIGGRKERERNQRGGQTNDLGRTRRRGPCTILGIGRDAVSEFDEVRDNGESLPRLSKKRLERSERTVLLKGARFGQAWIACPSGDTIHDRL